MRRLYSYMALSLLAFAAGCQREEVVSVEQDNDVMEVYATIEDVDDVQTRTYLSGTDVYWSSGDKIAVFYKNTLRKLFDVTPESIDSKNATFLLDEGYVQMGSNVNVSHNVAYYPFCEVTCAPDGSSYTLDNLTLPETQAYVAGSVGLGSFPMVAVTQNIDDVNFRFKNICGVMQFQLTGYGFVKSVSVKGNNEEILSGPAVVTAGYGKEPSIAMSAEGGKSVTLDCGEGGVELNETTPVSFFIVLPPVQFEGGFTITVTDTWGGSKEYSTTKKNPVGRSKGLRMPAKEYVGERPVQEGDYIDEYGKNHGQGIEIDGVVWAPVNCGYHATDFKYGKLYQWGRKYGVGYYGELWDNDVKTEEVYEDGILPETVDGLVNLDEYQASENTNVFFKMTRLPDARYYPHWRSSLWNSGTDEDPVKTEYDPCPEGWRVPTCKELGLLCSNKLWDFRNGQYGYWLTGTLSYMNSVNKVFFPAAGAVWEASQHIPEGRGNAGLYWTSMASEGCYYGFLFDPSDFLLDDMLFGNASATVRCVKDDSELICVESITINKTALTLSVGTTETLSASFLPANANQKDVYWYSKDNRIATVDASGKIEAKGSGTVVITAMAGMQTATCTVTVVTVQEGDYVDEYGKNHGQGIEIDGVVWAPVNCGYHATDFKYGKLYQWGRKYGQGYNGSLYSHTNTSFVGTYSDSEIPTIQKGRVTLEVAQSEESSNFFYTNDSVPFDWLINSRSDLWNGGTEGNPVKTEYDPCPSGWRVPTKAEFAAFTQMNYSWTTNDLGQEGYLFTGSSAHSEETHQIFFSAGGYRSGEKGTASSRGNMGYYWTSTPYPIAYNCSNYCFFFNPMWAEVSMSNQSRSDGHLVRCVRE